MCVCDNNSHLFGFLETTHRGFNWQSAYTNKCRYWHWA